MAEGPSGRKLASIVAIDVAGYSRRTETDEDAAIRAVAALRERVTRSAEAHGGRVFNTAGDGFMLEFPSASSALAAAEEIAVAGDPPVRTGVHLGEVSVTASGDILGHGVNVAARIQQMASPGAVLVSGDVKRAIRGPLGERLTPQGSVRLDKMSETLPVFALAPAKGGRAKGRRLDLKVPLAAGVGVLVLALAGLSLWQARGAWTGAQSKDVRVAILPFQTRGEGPALRDFADGLTDQVVGVLNANGVQTVSQSGGAGLSGPKAAATSGADFVLAGSIRSDGQTLRVTTHVDDAHNQVVLWSGEVARPQSQALPLQQQAAAKLAAVLRCAVRARQARFGPGDAETLSIYLRACDEGNDNTTDLGQMQKQLGLLRQLTARAPKFSHGHSDLAFQLNWTSQWLPADQAADLRREARTEAEKALALDRTNGDAYTDLADLLPPVQRTQREVLLRRAVSVEPTSVFANWRYSQLLTETGRLQEALGLAQNALALDPLSPDQNASAADALRRVGRTDAADAIMSRAQLAWPNASATWGERFFLALWASRFDSALSMLDEEERPQLSAAERDAWRQLVLTLKSRDPELVAAQREAQIAFGETSTNNLGPSVANLAQLGLVDDAFAQAEKLPANLPVLTRSVLFVPPTAAMRRDPRFMHVAAKIGLVDYWRSTGKWPDFCSEPGLPYDCKADAAKLVARPAR